MSQVLKQRRGKADILVMSSPPARRLADDGSGGASPDGTRWIDRWLATVADLASLKDSHPMLDAVIDEVDGRMIRIGDRWLAEQDQPAPPPKKKKRIAVLTERISGPMRRTAP